MILEIDGSLPGLASFACTNSLGRLSNRGSPFDFRPSSPFAAPKNRHCPKVRTASVFVFIPTRCRNFNLKQFCLDNIAPDILIILISHIIIAIRWVLIKILSTVINHLRECIVIVPCGCYLIVSIIRKIDWKIKMSLIHPLTAKSYSQYL